MAVWQKNSVWKIFCLFAFDSRFITGAVDKAMGEQRNYSNMHEGRAVGEHCQRNICNWESHGQLGFTRNAICSCKNCLNSGGHHRLH